MSAGEFAATFLLIGGGIFGILVYRERKALGKNLTLAFAVVMGVASLIAGLMLLLGR